MYIKLHPILINCISRNTGPYFRIFRQSTRSKSELISTQSFFYKEFENVLPRLMDKVSKKSIMPINVLDRAKKIAECSKDEENLFRGSLAIFAYERLEKSEAITEKLLFQIRTLAWGAEMLHAYFMILEDLDKSPGAAYWCSFDPSLLRGLIYELLRMEFESKPSYVDIVHLFDKAFLNTTIGQHLDNMNRKDYNSFTNETYNSIADLKTCCHTFQLPISLALKVVNNDDGPLFSQMQGICLQLGRLYHMQTDYLDCYGEETDQSGIPKHSRDIQLGRCSWLAVSALQRCTPAQRIVFTACYGSKEPAHIERIKLLYDQLQLPNIYREERDKMCDSIVNAAEKEMSTYDVLILNILNVIKDRDNIQ